jgi:periplasmic protein TonB
MKKILYILVFLPFLSIGQNSQLSDTSGQIIDYYKIEKKPIFTGGKTELMKYIFNNMKCPEISKDFHFSKIYYTFIIDTNGIAIEPYVLVKGIPISDKFEKCIIDLNKNMPNWTPGENNGKKVKVYMSIPLNVDFDL